MILAETQPFSTRHFGTGPSLFCFSVLGYFSEENASRSNFDDAELCMRKLFSLSPFLLSFFQKSSEFFCSQIILLMLMKEDQPLGGKTSYSHSIPPMSTTH